MKTKILLFILSITTTIYGQNWVLNIKIKPDDKPKGYPIENLTKLKNFSKNIDKINELKPSYPNAKNKELLSYYTLKGQGDLLDAYQALANNAVVESVEIDEVAYTLLCVNPYPDVNDLLVTQGISNNYGLTY